MLDFTTALGAIGEYVGQKIDTNRNLNDREKANVNISLKEVVKSDEITSEFSLKKVQKPTL